MLLTDSENKVGLRYC